MGLPCCSLKKKVNSYTLMIIPYMYMKAAVPSSMHERCKVLAESNIEYLFGVIRFGRLACCLTAICMY